jgi:signal peptidase I
VAVSARDPQQQLPDGPEGHGRHARGRSPRRQGGGALRWLRETGIIVVSALILSALVRAFLIQAFYVPSASMEDTLLISDRIIASKITTTTSGVGRGEVVVFKDPGDWLPDPPPPPGGFRGVLRQGLTFVGLLPSDTGKDLVKRAIAVQGDRIACCDVDGRIVLNGVPLVEDYIIGPTDQVQFDVVVPDGRVFVMGDNRGDSRDSRFHLETDSGTVPDANVVGRVVLVVWPLNRFSTVPVPEIFSQAAILDGPRGLSSPAPSASSTPAVPTPSGLPSVLPTDLPTGTESDATGQGDS